MTSLHDSARCEHDWVGFCTKEMLCGSNRKASSQINSSRSFRPLRPRSRTSHSRLDWPNPRAPLLSRCVACCGASGRLPVFSNLAVLIFRRVCEGSPSLLVVLICCPLTPVCREGSTELAVKKNYSCKKITAANHCTPRIDFGPVSLKSEV